MVFGQTNYENCYNSGIGSNGLTSARHDIFDKSLAVEFPESFDNSIDPSLVYCGTNKIFDKLNGQTLGKLVLSPTRTYAPVVKEIFKFFRKHINGMIHCTGGGQTKILNFVDNLHIVKNNMFETPPLFKLIKKESNANWSEMYKVFNMGHRMEIYVDPKLSKEIISLSKSFGLDAKVIGFVENSHKKKLTIETPDIKVVY